MVHVSNEGGSGPGRAICWGRAAGLFVLCCQQSSHAPLVFLNTGHRFTLPTLSPAARPADVLARFEADLGYLAATELHPALRSEGSTHLVHLVPAAALREAAAACGRGHQHFSGKVAELDGRVGGLKADVEALFMQVGRG